ncbi:fatty-acid amide hydrolase 2-B [Nephila pilipes]|uniref:Fatty-acid amide hydrolase 2-B n=1 Tax=Nephila pilipes TaxID=299642 RepID=A0A8X6NC74_NEPPI|nr:fatty-acid amide hydrolase 2-B [Nephila pilipes]
MTVISNPVRAMQKSTNILVRIEEQVIIFLRFILHRAMIIWFGGKGKTVSPVENPLLLKSATKLAEEIREGKLRCENVIEAYIERIQEVDPYINATVERCFEVALKEAREVDSLVASGKYSKEKLAEEKPLLGVPFTVKMLLNVKGHLNSGGCQCFANDRATSDAECVALFRKAGAIFIATTNVPEIGMNMETFNYMHGRTNNPYDTNRVAGGSSGGEASLIAAGGSVIGLGNDLLGSLRNPAHFNGIFGHKSTHDLVPNKGSCPPEKFYKMTGAYEILVAGPLCRYAEDMIPTMRVLAVGNEKVRRTIGQPVDFKKLKILYLTEMIYAFNPPFRKDIIEGTKTAASYFRTHYGVEDKEVKFPILYDIASCIISELNRCVPDLTASILGGTGRPLSVKWDLIKSMFGKSVFSLNLNICMNFSHFPLIYSKGKSTYYHEMMQKVAQYFDILLDENTVLFLPSFPTTAPYHHELILSAIPTIPYSGLFNFLGLPVTECHFGYDKEGLPFGFQIIGRKNNDNLTIACAIELQKAFGGWTSPGKV